MKLVIFLLPAMLGFVAAQTVIPNGAPASYRFDGRVDEWIGLPPTFALHTSQSGGRHGSVWIRQVPEGLLIAGNVDGPAPDFATSTEDMTRKDHVEVWLAPPTQPLLPPIGYGDQSQEISNIEACGGEQKCREWFQKMVVHRRLMGRTFVRQYGMSPGAVFEAFAKPAYEQMLAPIEPNFQKYVAAVAPSGAPTFLSAPSGAGGYSFEALVPWEAFPPFASLQLRRFQLMVDVFSAHTGASKDQPYSSTSASRRYGDPSSFNTVALETGRQFHVTACGYPLAGRNQLGESGPALFFPQRAEDVTRVFRLLNFEPIYSFYLSPITEVTDFAEKQMPDHAVVCGPRLAVARNGAVQRFARDVDPATLDVKMEPDGSYLLLSGPTWKRATKSQDVGCCEGLPMIDFHVWVISPAGKIRQIFEDHVLMSGIALGVVDMDVEVNPDATKITTFVALFSTVDHESHWSSATYCRKGLAYKRCGHDDDASPPKRKQALKTGV